MGYRELSRMEIIEVVRRWQIGESQRAIARASGVARETVKKYLHAAEELGLAANGPPPGWSWVGVQLFGSSSFHAFTINGPIGNQREMFKSRWA